MIRVAVIFFLGTCLIFSCNDLRSKRQDKQKMQNQLVITAAGDTLENGFWTYESGTTGVLVSGSYSDGYKTGRWTYKTNSDSTSVSWNVTEGNGVKFNIPGHFKKIDDAEPPSLFHFDIEDNDYNTYVVLLRYSLPELNASIYDYLYQYNKSWENISSERLKSAEFKKFTFRGIEIFSVRIESEGEKKYVATSYIFAVNEFLYDLTYKCSLDTFDAIHLEIFRDVLYSMECEGVDLFNYNNRKYLKEEVVEIKSDNVQSG